MDDRDTYSRAIEMRLVFYSRARLVSSVPRCVSFSPCRFKRARCSRGKLRWIFAPWRALDRVEKRRVGRKGKNLQKGELRKVTVADSRSIGATIRFYSLPVCFVATITYLFSMDDVLPSLRYKRRRNTGLGKIIPNIDN